MNSTDHVTDHLTGINDSPWLVDLQPNEETRKKVVTSFILLFLDN